MTVEDWAEIRRLSMLVRAWRRERSRGIWGLRGTRLRGRWPRGPAEVCALRESLDPAEATDVLVTIAGADVFLNFTAGLGVTLQRYATWTSEALCARLMRTRSAPNPSPDFRR